MRKNTKRFLVRHRTSFEPMSSRTKVSQKQKMGQQQHQQQQQPAAASSSQ